jgi:hypothetical protein
MPSLVRTEVACPSDEADLLVWRFRTGHTKPNIDITTKHSSSPTRKLDFLEERLSVGGIVHEYYISTRQSMIIETALFKLRKGVDRNQVMALYAKTAASWAANPDLIEKYYYFDPTTGEGGGVYFWPDRAAAEKWHGADYRRMVVDTYGSEPRIRIFDALMHVGPSGAKQL